MSKVIERNLVVIRIAELKAFGPYILQTFHTHSKLKLEKVEKSVVKITMTVAAIIIM
jgi:hypothetical protein